MYLIDQEIANEIAKRVPMKYPEIKRAFLMEEEEADQWEMAIRNEVEAQSDRTVARVIGVYLVLLLENQAITKYIRMTKNQSLRTMMPEILTVEEMILMAQGDMIALSMDQEKKVRSVVIEYQARLKSRKD